MRRENPHIPIDPASLDDNPALGKSLISYMDKLFKIVYVNPCFLDSSLVDEPRVTIERYRSEERNLLRQRQAIDINRDSPLGLPDDRALSPS
jgi:hypothetical protein